MSPAELDARDVLSLFRAEFVIADDTVYLDGNSLGRMPKRVSELMTAITADQWGSRLVRGWSEGWMELPERLGGKIAQLIGARSDEVLVADSTSVNLFKLVTAALKARPRRSKIVTEATNFPSDLYVLQGCRELLNTAHRIECVASPDGIHLPADGIERELDRQTALVALTHTAFKSGYVHDMARITESAHSVGALSLWDLSHSVGAMPIDLNGSKADLAVGCCYKYLNGGPGAPAFLYVRKELQEELLSPIYGWLGHKSPFDFALDYEPASGIRRFFAGTPPILAMAAIEPGVDLLLAAGMEDVRAKSVAMTELLARLWGEHLRPLGVSFNSPTDPKFRGSHVSFGHPDAYRIDQALIKDKCVIPDFRRPDNIRFGVAPLYNTFSELECGVLRMKEVIESDAYKLHPLEPAGVT